MPDQNPPAAERYRCTFRYGPGVLPPRVPGEVATRVWFGDRAEADGCVEEGVARTDLGRIVLEQQISPPGQRQEWGVLHEWVVTAEGWQLVE